MVKEKYQWAQYIKSLGLPQLRHLIMGLEQSISVDIDVERNGVLLHFARRTLKGDKEW